MSLYDDLGVAATATLSQIRAAFKRLASRHHPDKGGKAEDFQRIQHAYSILTSPQRRLNYDAGQDDQIPNDSAQLFGTLAQMLQAIVENSQDIERVNFLQAMQQQITAARQQILTQLAAVQRKAAKYHRAAKKIKRKSPGENRLAQMLEHAALELEKQTKGADQALAFNLKLQETLQDYEDTGADLMLELQRAQIAGLQNQGQHWGWRS